MATTIHPAKLVCAAPDERLLSQVRRAILLQAPSALMISAVLRMRDTRGKVNVMAN
jgi:hypothetical protein